MVAWKRLFTTRYFSSLTHLVTKALQSLNNIYCIFYQKQQLKIFHERYIFAETVDSVQYTRCPSVSKPRLHLRFSTRTGNSTSLKLFSNRSRRRLHVLQGINNICNMLQKAQFDKYSGTYLSQRFCRRTCLWLHVQHSGFKILATSEGSVVLPVEVKMSHV